MRAGFCFLVCVQVEQKAQHGQKPAGGGAGSWVWPAGAWQEAKEAGNGQILQTSDPVSDGSHLCSTKVMLAAGGGGLRGSTGGQGLALATQGRDGGIQELLYLEEDGLLCHGRGGGVGEGLRGEGILGRHLSGLGSWVDGDASGGVEMGEEWHGFGQVATELMEGHPGGPVHWSMGHESAVRKRVEPEIGKWMRPAYW